MSVFRFLEVLLAFIYDRLVIVFLLTLLSVSIDNRLDVQRSVVDESEVAVRWGRFTTLPLKPLLLLLVHHFMKVLHYFQV